MSFSETVFRKEHDLFSKVACLVGLGENVFGRHADYGTTFRTSFKYIGPAINGVMPLALCPQVVSQAPQHFRSSLGLLKRSNLIFTGLQKQSEADYELPNECEKQVQDVTRTN